MTCHYLDLGGASNWVKQISNRSKALPDLDSVRHHQRSFLRRYFAIKPRVASQPENWSNLAASIHSLLRGRANPFLPEFHLRRETKIDPDLNFRRRKMSSVFSGRNH